MLQDSQLRQEILDKCEVSEFTALDLMVGFLVASGEVSWSTKGLKVLLTLRNKENVPMVANCLHILYGYHPEVQPLQPADRRRARVYLVDLPEKISQRLLEDCRMAGSAEEGGALFGLGDLSSWVNINCYLTALYLECGRLYSNDDYRLDLVLPCSEQRLDELREVLSGYEVRFSHRFKEDKLTLSFRKDAIAQFVALMGAGKSSLEISEFYVERNMNGDINRRTNFYTSNLDKSLGAAAHQIWAISTLRTLPQWASLPRETQETCLARLENPDLSLTELAARLSISKSTLYHRIKRVTDLADSLDTPLA